MKKISLTLVTAGLFSGISIASLNISGGILKDVSEEYDFMEGVDQAAHHLVGYAGVKYFQENGIPPCQAIEEAMSHAVEREFRQKPAELQIEKNWCRQGCRRDLVYWLKGMEKGADCFHSPMRIDDFLP